jgi:hypothetical protein
MGTSLSGKDSYLLSYSARRFLHERADPGLFGGSQLLQREGDRPHGTFIEVRRVIEAERRVPRVELLRGLEEADDFAVLVGVRGHPVPGFRQEGRRTGFEDRMDPLGHGTIRFLHRGDRCECGAFPFRLVLVRARLRFQFLAAISHRGLFLVRESLGLLAGRCGALGVTFTWVHKNLLISKLLDYGLFLPFYLNLTSNGKGPK